jgi:hypothetical protein
VREKFVVWNGAAGSAIGAPAASYARASTELRATMYGTDSCAIVRSSPPSNHPERNGSS